MSHLGVGSPTALMPQTIWEPHIWLIYMAYMDLQPASLCQQIIVVQKYEQIMSILKERPINQICSAAEAKIWATVYHVNFYRNVNKSNMFSSSSKSSTLSSCEDVASQARRSLYVQGSVTSHWFAFHQHIISSLWGVSQWLHINSHLTIYQLYCF